MVKTQVALTASIVCRLDELVVVKHNIFLGKPKLPLSLCHDVCLDIKEEDSAEIAKMTIGPSGNRAMPSQAPPKIVFWQTLSSEIPGV